MTHSPIRIILDRAQTGDLLICSSYNMQFTEDDNNRFTLSTRLWTTFLKYLQKGITFSPWTHVGIIIREGADVYLFEAVADDIYKYDLLQEQPCSTGFRLIKLEDKVCDYNGRCAWVPLYHNDQDQHASKLPSLQYFRDTILPSITYNKKFQVYIPDIIKSIFLGPNKIKRVGTEQGITEGFITDSYRPYMMCSETIYYLYYRLGIIDGVYKGSQYLPYMFLTDKLDLKKYYSLGNPVLIDYCG